MSPETLPSSAAWAPFPCASPEPEPEDVVADPDAFARCAIAAICTAGVSEAVGRRQFERCCRALALGCTVRLGFRHPGKADAIDRIWRERHRLHRAFAAAPDRTAHLATLPWIGPATRRRLAGALGLAEPADPTVRAAA